eukprot:scaffold80_cov325-Pavlova_lutheri.AAC.22
MPLSMGRPPPSCRHPTHGHHVDGYEPQPQNGYGYERGKGASRRDLRGKPTGAVGGGGNDGIRTWFPPKRSTKRTP